MIRHYLILSALLFVLFSCEEEFTPPVSTDPTDIVVEGFIEAGDRATPPYVILTRSVPFFSRIDREQLENLFVHDAVVTVDDGERQVQLTELCLEDLPPEVREQAAEFLGIEIDSLGFNFCAYVDLSGELMGQEGRTYTLDIAADGKQLSAVTTIPPHVPLDSLWFVEPPGEPNDTLAQLRVFLPDPAGMTNYYRYATQINSGPLLTPTGSVVDDRLFDGQRFQFPLARAEAPGEDFDLSTFGLYTRGDTVTIKWITLDEAHYNFWNTLEFAQTNQGPFSSYTRVDHNIEGGLGIWGGLSASYYTLLVPEK